MQSTLTGAEYKTSRSLLENYVEPLGTLRFGKPVGGFAEVSHVVENLDPAWFDAQSQLVERETKKPFGLSMAGAIGSLLSSINR
jgi:hypothetical protein